jgi:5-methylcytosine-specific restriction endonuclease McrA
VFGLKHQILRTDAAGMPLEWVNYRDAVRLYHLGQVAYACGSTLVRVRGGINAVTGLRSQIDLNSIIATYGSNYALNRDRDSYVPPLNNAALFKRDAYLCLYCGEHFRDGELSRDHVTPLSQDGADAWNNVVTACKRCNNHKAGRRPEQARMMLLAVPFTLPMRNISICRASACSPIRWNSCARTSRGIARCTSGWRSRSDNPSFRRMPVRRCRNR